mgnify:CR=1 FL=1
MVAAITGSASLAKTRRTRASMTVRVTPVTDARLVEVAELLGESLHEVLECAVDEHRTRVFFDIHNAAHAAIRSDSKLWSAKVEERAAWDTTLAGGLEPE